MKNKALFFTLLSVFGIAILLCALLLIRKGRTEKTTGKVEQTTENTGEIDEIKAVLRSYSLLSKGFEDSESMTRAECLIPILRVCGADDDLARKYGEKLYSKPPYNDRIPHLLIEGYIRIGYESDIAYFEKREFGVYKTATVGRCILYMMRCLSDEITDENSAIKYAKDINFITDDDTFADDFDKQISHDDYCKLLYRLLSEQGYVFISPSKYANEHRCSYTIDDGQKMKYSEHLDLLKNKEVSTMFEYGIISEELAESESISRAECLTAVMRVTGVNDDFVSRNCKIQYEVPPLNDNDLDSAEKKWYVNVGALKGIALGKEYFADHSPRNFRPREKALVSDCIFFIMNCVYDTNDALKDAENIGLISKEDAFYGRLDENLTADTMCKLLYRMMNMKRYLYFSESYYSAYPDSDGFSRDLSGNVTYKEYLDEKSE